MSAIEEVYKEARNQPRKRIAVIEVPVSPEIYLKILREGWNLNIPPEMEHLQIRVTADFGGEDRTLGLRGGVVKEARSRSGTWTN